MKEALEFLVGKRVLLGDSREVPAVLFPGNVEGSYYCANTRFMFSDVTRIEIAQNGTIRIYLQERAR